MVKDFCPKNCLDKISDMKDFWLCQIFAGFLAGFWIGFLADFWHYIRVLYSTFSQLLPICKGKAWL
jgi:hypothetical protein